MVQVGPTNCRSAAPGGKPSSRRWPTTSGVRVHDSTAQHPAPVYGAGRVSGRGIYALPLGIRFGKTATIAASAAWALALSAFLQATGSVPLAWWIPCMAAAVGIQYLYLWVTRTISLLEAGYVCARAFVLAELAASAEWQLHCFLWPQRSGADGLSLLLLVVVYGGVFGCIWVLEHKHKSPKGISSSAEKRPSWPSSWRRWSSR